MYRIVIHECTCMQILARTVNLKKEKKILQNTETFIQFWMDNSKRISVRNTQHSSFNNGNYIFIKHLQDYLILMFAGHVTNLCYIYSLFTINISYNKASHTQRNESIFHSTVKPRPEAHMDMILFKVFL